MSAHRYRLPRGLQKSPPVYVVVRRNGDFLLDPDVVPFVWSDRHPLAFRSREAAERSAWKWFMGPSAMREHGIRVERMG